MLCNNHPAISYVAWYGLVIIGEDEIPYVITDGKSCMKYLYWDKTNPYILKESNEWIEESVSQIMIYINENGTATEVPHDNILVYYNDAGNGVASKLTGEALGKYDELNGRYMIVQEDVNGIKEVLGYEGEGDSGSVIERLNKVEKTAEGTTETIKTIEKNFANDKEMEALRNNMNISIINIGEALLYLEDELDNMAKDLEVSADEKTAITEKQNALSNAYTILSNYHKQLITKLEASEEDTSATVLKLNQALSFLNDSIKNLNNNVTTDISDNTIVPSELTTMLSLVANVALKNNEYKNTLSDAILLGVGGKLTESMLDMKKTSNSFSQTISNIQYEIDGETGLKKQISDTKSSLEQNLEGFKATVSETYVKTDSLDSLKEEFREELGDYIIIFSKETIIARCDENGNLIK